MIWANGWLWIIAALRLAALELAMPGWFFLGMAVAVLVMGAALLLGLWGGGLPMALVVTAAVRAPPRARRAPRLRMLRWATAGRVVLV